MAPFFVFWNTVVRKTKVHRASCGACKNGQGMHEGRIQAGKGDTYDWVPAASYAEAAAIAASLKRSKPILASQKSSIECGLCRPARNSN